MQESFTVKDSNQEPKLSEKAGTKAKEYQALRNGFFLIGLAINLGGLTLSLAAGLSVLFKTWATSIYSHPVSVVFFYFLFFSLYFLVLEFPFEIYSGFIVEKKYGLSNMSFRRWLFKEAKKHVISFLFAAILIETLYFFIRTFPANWWLFAWGGWFFVTVLIGKFAHIVILPLFYKCARLENEALREKILKLLEKNHFPIADVYTMNLSKTTRKVNAAFSGLGSTRRVLLADTLLENFSHDEIETVVAHELGHARKHHLLKGIFFNTVVSFAVFYLAFQFLNHWTKPLGFQGPEDVASFPLLGLVGFFSGLVLMPINNLYSRFHEREADDFALKQSANREAFVSALTKLGHINLADFEPNPLIEFFLYSHPSLGKRIHRVQSS